MPCQIIYHSHQYKDASEIKKGRIFDKVVVKYKYFQPDCIFATDVNANKMFKRRGMKFFKAVYHSMLVSGYSYSVVSISVIHVAFSGYRFGSLLLQRRLLL